MSAPRVMGEEMDRRYEAILAELKESRSVNGSWYLTDFSLIVIALSRLKAETRERVDRPSPRCYTAPDEQQ